MQITAHLPPFSHFLPHLEFVPEPLEFVVACTLLQITPASSPWAQLWTPSPAWRQARMDASVPTQSTSSRWMVNQELPGPKWPLTFAVPNLQPNIDFFISASLGWLMEMLYKKNCKWCSTDSDLTTFCIHVVGIFILTTFHFIQSTEKVKL